MTLLSACDIFKSSTCDMTVHCCRFIVLFDTHLSYSFSFKPHSIRVSDNSLQNAACSVPYSASHFTISSAIVLLNVLSVSMSVCKKSLGMPVMTMYHPSLVSIALDIIKALVIELVELVSALVVYYCCTLLSAHP